MAWEWATEAGVGARVALRTIESTHVSPTSTCPHSGAVRCTPPLRSTRGDRGRTGNLTVLVMGAAAQAGRSAEPDRWVEIFCSLVAIVECYNRCRQLVGVRRRKSGSAGGKEKKSGWENPHGRHTGAGRGAAGRGAVHGVTT